MLEGDPVCPKPQTVVVPQASAFRVGDIVMHSQGWRGVRLQTCSAKCLAEATMRCLLASRLGPRGGPSNSDIARFILDADDHCRPSDRWCATEVLTGEGAQVVVGWHERCEASALWCSHHGVRRLSKGSSQRRVFSNAC